jgi:predicted flap endonuclease-1-like 5' DNA nuclease
MTSLDVAFDPPLAVLLKPVLSEHARATAARARSHAEDLQARATTTLKAAAHGAMTPLPLTSAPETLTVLMASASDGLMGAARYQAAAGAAVIDLAHFWWFGADVGNGAAASGLVKTVAEVRAKAAQPAQAAPKPADEPAPATSDVSPVAADAPAPLEPAPVEPDAAAKGAAPVAAEIEAEASPGVQPFLYAAAPAHADDLLVIKGVGPKINAFLNTLGVYTYAQIAAWSPEEIAWVESKLDFNGRVTREQWVAQAEALSAA